ncbi:MAG: 16S rRNA (cytidine(1402)-2'-O)-methyltransferase [Erysipelothrix sp.]|nr:16S rRNA (cytidine(1402)-2'-O)-methyltransferase [Erysipelothrix sp.]
MKRQKSFGSEIPTLFIVATPIGNLQEMTPRAIEILKDVDVIACEDTRQTKKLLDNFEIKTKLISHHAHNEKESANGIIELLKDNQNIALVSDAGYPLISDPGYLLVQKVISEGFNVVPISGSSALLNALVASGIVSQPFLFHGFLPTTKKHLRKILREYKHFSHTMIFYVAVHRLRETLEIILENWGERQVSLAREMTKLHEEFIRGQLSDLIEIADELKGEFVLVIEGNPHEKEPDIQEVDITRMVEELIAKGFSASQAIREVAAMTSLSKNAIYDIYTRSLS